MKAPFSLYGYKREYKQNYDTNCTCCLRESKYNVQMADIGIFSLSDEIIYDHDIECRDCDCN